MTIHWGIRLRKLREERNWTQGDVASRASISRELVTQYETGRVKNLTDESLSALARALDMTPAALASYLHGGEKPVDRIPSHDLITELKERLETSELLEIPVRGYVTAGIPAPTEQQDLGTILIPKSALSGVTKVSGLFGLIVSGDSLQGDEIENGDTVIVEPQPDLIDGKIYIVDVSGEHVARHLHRDNGSVILTSSNGKYARMTANEVIVQGRVVLSGRWVKH